MNTKRRFSCYSLLAKLCPAAIMPEYSNYVLLRRIFIFVILYFCCSISITFYNQQLMHIYRFPLSITFAHFAIKFIIAGCIRQCMYVYSGEKRVMLSWHMYVAKVAIAGTVTSLDIGLSNWSLEYITVSLYTMTKSTAVIFILLFAVCFKLEKAHCCLIVIVLFITAGILLFTHKSTQFHLFGFLLALSAAVLSGMRWSLSQLVLQKKELHLGNPVDFIYHLEPWMMVALLPISFSFEGLTIASSEQVFGFTDIRVVSDTAVIVLLGAMLAFALEYTEFMLVSICSSLTLAIVNIIKEITIVSLAVLIKGDHLSVINTLGLVMCLIGVSIHLFWKVSKGDLHAMEVHTRSRTTSLDVEESEMSVMLAATDGEEEVLTSR